MVKTDKRLSSKQELIFQELSSKIINAAIKVHTTLGPGLLESIYERALCKESEKQGIGFEPQKEVEIFYEGESVGTHRIDLIVEHKAIVELKAHKDLEEVHFAQVRSYLKASGLRLGLLLNFNKPTLEIKRVVN
jgi:GxxExxY protein